MLSSIDDAGCRGALLAGACGGGLLLVLPATTAGDSGAERRIIKDRATRY
jgi:hypothetical protein